MADAPKSAAGRLELELPLDAVKRVHQGVAMSRTTRKGGIDA
ncbi:MAG: hypothetical protein NTX53_03915 [candidate division WOR-3 bacterium]|nr:hypothetical protein [candidate division WOR-3 bacterium]